MTDEPKKLEETKVEAKPEVKAEEKQAAAEVKPEKKTVKVSSKLQKLIEEVEKLSVLELAELVKALEDKFGVTVPAMQTAASPAPTGAGAPTSNVAGAVEEKTEFDVMLTDSGANKIGVIKVVREIKPDLGLKEAKDLVDKGKAKLLEGAKKVDAEEAKKKLEAAGAQVELK